MDPQLAQEKLKGALKLILKRRNLTYKEVASVWACSVPTVKRTLGKEDLPLSRLLTLLDWLDINLSELEKLAESGTSETPHFTARQSDFLANNPHYFAFLTRLYKGDSPEKIKRQHQLSAAALDTYLRRLETYDLIRVTGTGRVRPFHAQMPGINGRLAEIHYRNVIDSTAAYFKNQVGAHLARAPYLSDSNKSIGFSITALESTEKSFTDYIEKIRKLDVDLAKLSHFESQQYDKSQLKVFVKLTAYNLDEPKSKDLQLIDEAVGEIIQDP